MEHLQIPQTHLCFIFSFVKKILINQEWGLGVVVMQKKEALG